VRREKKRKEQRVSIKAQPLIIQLLTESGPESRDIKNGEEKAKRTKKIFNKRIQSGSGMKIIDREKDGKREMRLLSTIPTFHFTPIAR
jgi:hypothetical protein